ncbi:hypothetical protein DIPPA_35352 [Diplonema papillatum]|nr:hypothetical protein DIPPA_35352 [Diplonema papillatum]
MEKKQSSLKPIDSSTAPTLGPPPNAVREKAVPQPITAGARYSSLQSDSLPAFGATGNDETPPAADLDEVTRLAAERLGLGLEQAKDLYWGGIEANIASGLDDEKIEPHEPDEEVANTRIPVQELNTTQVVRKIRVKPVRQEHHFSLNTPYEQLGFTFNTHSVAVKSVMPGGAASRAGLLPCGIVVMIAGATIRTGRDVVDAVRSLRIAKRTEFSVEVYYEIPATDIASVEGPAMFTATSLIYLPRIEPQWRNRADVASYQRKPAGGPSTLAGTGSADPQGPITLQKIVDSATAKVAQMKKVVRVPKGLGRYFKDINLTGVPPGPAERARFAFNNAFFKLCLDEDAKRQEVFRLYRGSLMSLHRRAPSRVAPVILRVYNQLMSLSLDDMTEEGWEYVELWKHPDELKVLMGAEGPLTASRAKQSDYVSTIAAERNDIDWINPDMRESPELVRRRHGSPLREASPQWATDSIKAAIIFLGAGLRCSVRYHAFDPRIPPRYMRFK